MADSLTAKWPVAELSAVGIANGRSYLSAKEAAGLYDMKYSTFMKRLKDFVRYGEYPATAFRLERQLRPGKREYWLIGIHPVLGIRALNKHFYPRLSVQ
ncbi:MAG TPA: hypothetical protein VGU23_04865 [Acidobacteriaceae bacterium]|nr:hypothetical protein [Acidobacteriaceae bacterium]